MISERFLDGVVERLASRLIGSSSLVDRYVDHAPPWSVLARAEIRQFSGRSPRDCAMACVDLT